MLQNALNENSDARLKNIVATIQKEQNEIIRANMFKPLIIQGVAGSGKTTVALHRIAYLVYTYEKSFKPEDFLIIGPNKFFLSYISDVLPDLGVDYVMQQTFEEFAKCFIKEKVILESGNDKLKQIVESEKSEEEINNLICASKLKSSIEFKNHIDKCMQTINEQYLPKEDFKVKDIVVIKYDDLINMFLNGFEEISIEDRIERLEKFMINKTSNVADSILNKIKEERAKELNNIPKQLSDKEQKIYRDTIFAKMEYEIDSLLKDKGKKLVKDYIKKLNKLSSVQFYKEIINNTELDEITDYYEYIKNNFNKKISKKIIEYEDIAPIMYISFKLFKQNEKLNLKHIIIDEAQDFSEFQFIVLYEILNKNKSITVLGDLAQGIYSYRGTENWQRINELVFNGEAKIQSLEKSYRTTIDIMNEANKVLSKINGKIGVNLGEAISQNGIKPMYYNLNSFEEKIEKAFSLIENSKINGRYNIGIIAKDSKQCEKIYEEIKNKYDKVQLISDQIEVFDGGITIVPSYYSKGLEFDSVIIWDYNNYKDTSLDTKLLYVAMTRAMHELNMLN